MPKLVLERRGGAFATPGDREKAINDEIDRLRKRQMLVDESNAQVALLGEYFSDLEQFAKQDVAGEVQTATAGLTDSIRKESRRLPQFWVSWMWSAHRWGSLPP